MREDYGACSLRRASVAIVIEEGPGNYYCFPYATQADADRVFNSWGWKITSRILYTAEGGEFVSAANAEADLNTFSQGAPTIRDAEVVTFAGPAMAHFAIDRAVKRNLKV